MSAGYSLAIAPAAVTDIRDAFQWYDERNALAADGFRAQVFETTDRIADNPLGKAADSNGNRRRVLHRFPYTVVYELVANSTTILATAHHRREPGC